MYTKYYVKPTLPSKQRCEPVYISYYIEYRNYIYIKYYVKPPFNVETTLRACIHKILY